MEKLYHIRKFLNIHLTFEIKKFPSRLLNDKSYEDLDFGSIEVF